MSTDRDAGPSAEPSLAELVGDLTSELSDLVIGHVDLAKAEIRQDVRDAGKAGGMFGGASLAALIGLLMLSSAVAWGLAEVMAPGWAFLIVGLAWLAVAGALALSGKKQVDQMEPGPQATIDEIEEDQRWLKSHSS